MSEQTIFEKIIHRDIPADILHEDEYHIVILDISPFEKGHLLVIPKKPYETIMDMPQDEYESLQGLVHRFAVHMNSVLGGGVNVHQNNYALAHQEVPHVHVHVIPRNQDKQVYRHENQTGNYSSEAEKQSFIERLSL